LSDLWVFDSAAEKVPPFVERLSQAAPGVRIHAAATVEELLEASGAVITATTSRDPVLPDDAARLKGKHFIGIGSYKPAFREFPQAVFRLVETVYVDTEHAIEESGDLRVPLQEGWIRRDQVATLGRLIVSGRKPGGRTTLFKSVGMALFDVYVAKLVYERALMKGLGQTVDL
jgi:ornithine cyclodeaminase